MTLPKNLCLAPFAYLTFDPATNVSPCPALGGSTWNFKGKSLSEVWQSQELQDLRAGMLDNQKFKICSRCWEEESVGMRSERTLLWDPDKDPNGTTTQVLETTITPEQVLRPDRYGQGPMQLAIKVGNVCNLRCRSCNAADSVTLSVEGRYYAEKYGLTNNFYLKETETKVFTDQQIDDIVAMCGNVRRIEFYGGEPLLDRQLPRLLTKLIELGRADKIDLNISTNITQPINEDLVNILSRFRSLNLSLSMDGWAEKFTYLRHPANWDDAYQRVKDFIKLTISRRISMKLTPVVTVTAMNVHHLPELVDNMYRHFRLRPFLILARFPKYFSVRAIPEEISQPLISRLSEYTAYDFGPIIRALQEPKHPEHWKEFTQWTAMIDQYRHESFADTFPEYTQLIRTYDPNFLA